MASFMQIHPGQLSALQADVIDDFCGFANPFALCICPVSHIRTLKIFSIVIKMKAI